MALVDRLTSWFLIAVLTIVWAVPVSVVSARAQAGADAGRRIALVVGNTSYQSAEPLKNAVNDSRAVAESLADLGFEVFEVEDVDLQGFASSLSEFEKEAASADAAVFYYSGHGFQLGGANYLVPIDAKLNSREAIEKETLRLDDIIGRIQAHNRQTLIFIDACRNNPLPASVRGKNGDGLAQIETGSGTFVAFATQPGNITRDGAGDHSPFTSALLDHLPTPGISISDMMIRVRNSVEEQTLQTQTPWDQSSLRSQFYFNPEEEADAALTDEDRELLLSLDPALRAKFEQRFGIQIKDADEEGEDDQPVIASIQPRLLISDAETATGGAAVEETSTEEPAAAEAEEPATEEPTAEESATEEPATDLAAVAEETPVIGRLRILSGDEEEAVPERETEIAALDPAEGARAAAPPDAILNEAGDIPVPESRPDYDPSTAPPVEVAALDPATPAVDEAPTLPAPETVAPAASSSEPAPQAAEPPAIVAAVDPSPAVEAAAAPEPLDGDFVPAPIAPVTEKALRANSEETVEMAALETDSTSATRSTGISIAPVAGEIDRIAGQEVLAAPEPAAAPEQVVVPAPEPPAAVPAAEAPVAETPLVEEPALIMPTTPPEFPVDAPAVVAAAPAVPEPAAAEPAAAVEAAPSAPEWAAALDAAPVAEPAPAAPVEQAAAPAPVPVVPGAPVLIPAPAAVQQTPMAQDVATEQAPAAQEKEIELAALGPDDVKPPLIERAPPAPEEDDVDAVPVPTEEEQRETVRLIQTELTRLGCYRSGIDGDWGNNSARGLLRYFATKKEAPDNLDPDAALLARLQTEDTVVCTRTETVTPKAKGQAPKNRTVRNKPDRPVAVRTQKPSAPAAKSAPRAKTSASAPSAPAGGKRKLSRNLKLGGLR